MKRTPKRNMTRHGSKVALAAFLSMVLILGTLIVVGCDEKEVSLEYEPDPGLVIVKVEVDGGLPYPGDDLYPRLQLFGNGRVIKYREQENGGGILVQAKMNQEDMVELLKGIADTGYFKLKDEYWDSSIYDATYRKISVNLIEKEKTVMVGMMMDVPNFDAAYNLIMDYPLGQETEYVPDTGYLVVVKYSSQAGGGQNLLDPNSEIYKMLPDPATLAQAAASHTAVAVAGANFTKLKLYDNQQKSRGLYISQPDGFLVVYPVYEPRTAEKP